MNFYCRHLHSLDELSVNGLYDLSVNGLDVLSINVHPCDVRGLHGMYVSGMKVLSFNVCPYGGRESVEVTSESSLPGMNGLRP